MRFSAHMEETLEKHTNHYKFEKRESQFFQTLSKHSPGVTALQLTFQPGSELTPLVMNIRSTVLVVLVMPAGRKEPQLFSIKVVPLPSTIVRWSQQRPEEEMSTSNALNCSEMIN